MSRSNLYPGSNESAARQKAGNSSLAAIYRRHVKTIYRLCYSFLGNATDAEDATQNVFMRLVDHPRSFQSSEHEKAWLIVTAQNHCRDVLKSAYRRRTTLDPDQLDGSSPPESDRVDLEDAIYRLPEKYKTCVYLYYYEGYRSNEISRMLGVPDLTVRNYLSEARQLLKKSLGGE